MKIIDISLPLNNQTVVYPGNVPLEISVHHEMPEHATHLSKIVMGSHTGTHIDAPAHAVIGGVSLDQIPLTILIGPCRVLDFSEVKESVKIEDLKKFSPQKGERLLVKTSNSKRGFDKFYDDYIYLDGDAADYLVSLDISLFGIDYLSIKKRGGKDHRPHTSLLAKGIPIIEGIDLSKVEAGEYNLFCLPLKFTGIEGGPARAILTKN
ncbi:MAG: cyclase family protein [Candidatus Paceibacterota bacterium]|jgi:arylformamidase